MPCSRSTVFTVSTTSHKPQKLFTKDAQCHNLKSEAPEIFIRKSERFRLCSQLPEVFVKTKEVHAKFAAEEDFRFVIHKQGKKFFSERTWWGVWKTGRDLRCLPALSFSVSLISWQKGESRLWNSLLQRNNHSFPISLPYSLSVSLSLSVAHTDQTLLSMNLFYIAMNTNQQD